MYNPQLADLSKAEMVRGISRLMAYVWYAACDRGRFDICERVEGWFMGLSERTCKPINDDKSLRNAHEFWAMYVDVCPKEMPWEPPRPKERTYLFNAFKRYAMAKSMRM